MFKGNGRTATQFKQNLHINTRRAEDPATGVVKNPERHEELLEQAKQGNIDVLFLGDSITELFPIVGQESWLKLLPYKPASFGVGSDCTEHLIWRIEHGELDGITPKVVVILIGTKISFITRTINRNGPPLRLPRSSESFRHLFRRARWRCLAFSHGTNPEAKSATW